MGDSRKKKRKRRGLGLLSFDTNLIVAVLFLTVFGLIMIYSASYYKASMSESFHYDSAYFLKNQLKWSLVGLASMLVVANIDYHNWRFFALLGFAGSIVLVLLLKTDLGVTAYGATRWLEIPGLGRFQVAEPIKVAIIIFSAALISGKVVQIQKPGYIEPIKAIVQVLLPVLVVFVMIWKLSNNMSTAVIVLGITCVMIFMVYPRYWPIFLLLLVGGVGIAIYLYVLQQAPEASEGFRSDRILAWLDPYAYESDKAYQALQALYAIGSGGLFGKGLGNSIQKLKIPEPYNDMIFSIICEELGVFGAGLVILMFIYLLYRIYSITQQAEDLFGRLLSMGVFGHLALQVILNLAVVTSLIPTTGVTLPFFSAGGTATVFLFLEFGMVLNVEKYSRGKREHQAERAERMERIVAPWG
ncbi:MAG: cell division protein FtsW [Lachnospiraceae bacterium]|jgi:cell division protein FtsW|nr:cell division protein FtsW [Lachnospiraceae bacterium]MCI8995866.1 cell division protein FtsW [Lachnospiraceae bacterium]MCI9133593.1 cell division protein FtsW [Lachnospiraceae bacterium]